MANKVLLYADGAVEGLAGTNTDDVLKWNGTDWVSAAGGGGGGSGTVTSVGLTGGTSGIVIGGTASPITTSGTYELDAPQRFQLDTSADFPPTAIGQLSWNTAEGSLNTLMAGGNVDAIVGQQLYQRAVNADTVTLTKGMVVYVFGSSGTRVTVKRAQGNVDLVSATIIGVVAETIAQNAEGFVITNGLLKDLTVLPSTSFTDGDVVYLSPTTPGALTATKPVAPQHLVMVGYCVKASNGAAGVLLVHTQNGYEIGELHNVYTNGLANGQTIIYNETTERFENHTLTAGTGVSVTNGAGSISVAIGQAVGTGDSPSFTGLTVSGLTNGLVRATSGVLAGAATVALGSEVTGTLGVTNGGTGLSTIASGSLLYASGANTLAAGSLSSLSWTSVTPNSAITLRPNTTASATFSGGGSSSATPAASVTVNGGNNTSTGNGGSATFTGGTTLNGTGGTTTLSGGSATTGLAGTVYVRGGHATSSGSGGDAYVDGGYSALSSGSALYLGTQNSAPYRTNSVTLGRSGITTTVNGTVNVSGLTASQYVKTDASKNLVSAATIPASDVTGIPYDIIQSTVGTYSNGEVVFRFVAKRAITLSSTAGDHSFKALTASTGSVTVLVKNGATTLLSVAFSASATGVVTVSNTAIAAGDEITVVMPATADATLAGVYYTITGSV